MLPGVTWNNTTSTTPGISWSHYPALSSYSRPSVQSVPVYQVCGQCCLCVTSHLTPTPRHWSRPQQSRQPCTAQPSKLKISKNSEEAKLSFPPPPCRKYEVSILINFMCAGVRCGQLQRSRVRWWSRNSIYISPVLGLFIGHKRK